MKNVWKTAPGDHAENWPLFSSNKCIGIGWLEEYDYSEFESRDAVLVSLVEEHGSGAKGQGAGAASIVWSFTNEIELNDIVIANDGRNRIVGVGIITSGYLHPKSPQNPLRNNRTTHRRHIRMVDWLIKQPVDIQPLPPRKYFFGIQTVHSLKLEDVEYVLNTYQTAYANDPQLLDALGQIFDVDLGNSTPKAVDLRIPPVRIETTTFRILRDTKVAIRVKELHNYQCQICGTTIELPNGRRYAEAHHIRPLGGNHEGDDAIENVLCLCPNHHAKCDYGVILLDLADISGVTGHDISPDNIRFHNEKIYGKGQ